MLTDFERQRCRDFKERQDAARTPDGKRAVKIGRQMRQAQENTEKVLQHYKQQSMPAELPKAEHKETAAEQILKLYKGGRRL